MATFTEAAWPQVRSEPDDDYLHEIVQKWTEKTSVGNLRDSSFADDDIEVRIWAGFGLRGSSGGVLRRHNGKWSISFLELETYSVGATNEIAEREGSLPPCIVEEMRERCVIETTTDTNGALWEYTLDCASVYRSPRHIEQRQLIGLWDKLEQLGVQKLPPTIEREWMRTDGHSYVIEVRVGDVYRATVTEHADETSADRQIHEIVSAFDSVLGTALYGGDE